MLAAPVNIGGMLNAVHGNVFIDLAPDLDRGAHPFEGRVGNCVVTSTSAALDACGLGGLVCVHDKLRVGCGDGTMLASGLGAGASAKHCLHAAGNLAIEATRSAGAPPGCGVLVDVSRDGPRLVLLPSEPDVASEIAFGWFAAGHDDPPATWSEDRKRPGAEWSIRNVPSARVLAVYAGGTNDPEIANFSADSPLAAPVTTIAPDRVSTAVLGSRDRSTRVEAARVSLEKSFVVDLEKRPCVDLEADLPETGRASGMIGILETPTAGVCVLGSGPKRGVTIRDRLGVGREPSDDVGIAVAVAGVIEAEGVRVSGGSGSAVSLAGGWTAGPLDTLHTHRRLDVSALLGGVVAGSATLCVAASGGKVVAVIALTFLQESFAITQDHSSLASRPDGRPRVVSENGKMVLLHDIDHVATVVALGCGAPP